MAKKIVSKTNLLSDFIDAIVEAHGCTDQLLHIYMDPRWIAIRETLLEVRNVALKLVVKELKI